MTFSSGALNFHLSLSSIGITAADVIKENLSFSTLPICLSSGLRIKNLVTTKNIEPAVALTQLKPRFNKSYITMGVFWR